MVVVGGGGGGGGGAEYSYNSGSSTPNRPYPIQSSGSGYNGGVGFYPVQSTTPTHLQPKTYSQPCPQPYPQLGGMAAQYSHHNSYGHHPPQQQQQQAMTSPFHSTHTLSPAPLAFRVRGSGDGSIVGGSQSGWIAPMTEEEEEEALREDLKRARRKLKKQQQVGLGVGVGVGLYMYRIGCILITLQLKPQFYTYPYTHTYPYPYPYSYLYPHPHHHKPPSSRSGWWRRNPRR